MAIKKIKIGQFKDGLDMSAVREVKYLRELQHENVIEVGQFTPYFMQELTYNLPTSASGRFLRQNELEPSPRIPRIRLGSRHQRPEPHLLTCRH